MINLIEYINDMQHIYGIVDPNFRFTLSKHLVSNGWFGCQPSEENGQLLLDDYQIELLGKKIAPFIEQYNVSEKDKTNYLIREMRNQLPKTAKLFERYKTDVGLDDESSHYLADFLICFLAGEIDESTDAEIGDLLNNGFDELPKVYGDILADFINWTHLKTKTIYKNVYYMSKYSDKSEESEAYAPDYYLKILYCLFNDDFIAKNDMYYHAAESKNYVDTWLFLSLHFLCSIRNTDLLRLPHPRLTDTPETVLEQISNGSFPKASARYTVYSVLWTLEALRMVPQKTEDVSGVSDLKIFVPDSVEVHLGTLFAAAEAHFQLGGYQPETPLIRIISSYKQINRYMGDEIGDLFLSSNFRSRSANKSYMQMISLLTDDILGIYDEFHVKGYTLATLARSHKGSYEDFAKTTSIYLKDAKMSGYSPEFVAKEMFERGVLSCIASMLLKMTLGEQYNNLTVENQTRMIKELNLLPSEVEASVSAMQKTMRKSTEIAKNLYQSHSTEDILNVLHRIGNGEAVSKNDYCMCLMTAFDRSCPFNNKKCLSCPFEICTKTTFFLMIRETIRLQDIYKTNDNELERNKSKSIANNVILPCINEMLAVIEMEYGEDTVAALELFIKEVIDNGK